MTDAPDEVQLLDHGYLKFVESWGSDQRIIESARMSTDGAFRGWGDRRICEVCGGTGRMRDNGGSISTTSRVSIA